MPYLLYVIVYRYTHFVFTNSLKDKTLFGTTISFSAAFASIMRKQYFVWFETYFSRVNNEPFNNNATFFETMYTNIDKQREKLFFFQRDINLSKVRSG